MNYKIKAVFLCVMILLAPSLVFANKTHIVKKNESLYALAKRYHVPINELKTANSLVNSRIKDGDVLVIPHRSVVSGAITHDKDGMLKTKSYIIKKGDTLVRISKKTGIPVKELKRLNSMSNKVKAGRVLAMRNAGGAEEPRHQIAHRVILRNSDLFNENDYEQSLADLTEPDPGQQMDLNKRLELNTDNAQTLKLKAYGFLGTRYRFGGSNSQGIDCSSFVQQVFREMEVSLPRTAREQFELGNEVALGDLQKGDLVFFRTYAHYPSHVGIYLGNSKMIHASSHNRRVVISSMNTSYYHSHFLGAKRIAKINPEIFRFEDIISGIEEESAKDATRNDSLDVALDDRLSVK